MGEGNYRPSAAVTRQCDPFDDFAPDDRCAQYDAWDDLIERVRAAAGPRAYAVERAWRDRRARIVARTGLHETTLYENSHGTVFVSVWPREDLDPSCEALARAQLERAAEALFRRLAEDIDLRVATSAWTSARWVPILRGTAARPAARPAH